MALDGAQADQFGQSHFNVWAMIKGLVFNHIGLMPFSGVPVSGTSGTFAKKAGPGTLVFNILTGTIYRNSGTQASPFWTNLSDPISGGAGLGLMGNAKVTYDFTVDGGVSGVITPRNSPTIPVGAIILGGIIDVTTALTSGGSATIAVGLGSGAQAAALKAATAVATYALNAHLPVIPVFTAATALKAAAATQVTLTVAVADLTAGVMTINLPYVRG